MLTLDDPYTNLVATGSVVDVLRGQPPTPDHWIELSPYVAAFEAGSPLDAESIGEFISFNGVGYTRSTQAGVGQGQLILGDRITSNGAVFLPRDARPAAVVEVHCDIAMTDLYESLHAQIGAPLCFIGTALFKRYHVTAITHAPIYGEEILQHREKYYAEPPIDLADVRAGMMGCIANLSDVTGDGLREGLGAVLYQNPLDPPAVLSAHTHTLQLKENVRRVQDILPEIAISVHHIIADSVVTSGRFEVYRINDITRLK